MSLASMTGFARVQSQAENVRWTWELRAVNGKGLDIRVRLPGGIEALEPLVRDRCAKLLKRGNVTAGLSVQRDNVDVPLTINEKALEAVLSAAALLRERMPDLPPPSIDGLLAQKGVFELKETEPDEAAQKNLHQAMLTSLDGALLDLVDMRHAEGAALGRVLQGHIARIAELTRSAEDMPARQPEAIRARLAAQVEVLLEASKHQLDPQRLHQEAAILATKADIREELDRLAAHVDAVRELLASGGAIGRRLDFLAQEFNREANTLCSKSNDVELTAIGLELKTVIDQMREQIQNLE
ncbi:hypothetical protein GCM10011316_13780 [Roseibium aquae]|uniref:YicC family protein n=1 Tax=Roseibium aquae TaxID=1323746 RepID=A0A916WY69_9HYPH|nr:YicC/YloC family endoribonuclease [Roseibium aquae]GGB43063.1 hypothetical protein GCM10011316_13780 [Roseibium aquae]